MPTIGKPALDESDWITLAEAARILDESRLTVLNRQVKGEIVAKHIAGRTVVSRASVERILAAKG